MTAAAAVVASACVLQSVNAAAVRTVLLQLPKQSTHHLQYIATVVAVVSELCAADVLLQPVLAAAAAGTHQ